METLELLSRFEPVAQIGIILLLAIIFWKPIAYRIGLRETQAEEVPAWAEELLQHFNHETTDNQQDILVSMKEMHVKQDRNTDAVRELTQTIKEMFTYGVKCRKE